ncbi:MAG: mercuric transporter MerT family protein [Planctomycetota bacterium]
MVPAVSPVACPACGQVGAPVAEKTLLHLVLPAGRTRVPGHAWSFCATASCDVVYYAAGEDPFATADVRVPVFPKATRPPRPVCYCFGHTIEGIEEEVARTGRSTVSASIAARVKAGECACETKNPKGRCCLGDVGAVVRRAMAGREPPPAPEVAKDCCAGEAEARPRAEGTPSPESPSHRERAGLLSATGAVLAAVLASACCWLPLLLLAFGASAVGLSAFFERFRPLFLGISAAFLLTGFYLLFLRKPRCRPGDACAVPSPGRRRIQRVVLLSAMALTVAVALFPNYVGTFLGPASRPLAAEPLGDSKTAVLRIDGMTCGACAGLLERKLAKIPGVRAVRVSYEAGRATLRLDPTNPPSPATLLDAIRDGGYEARVEEPAR